MNLHKRIAWNAPVTLTFSGICLFALILNFFTHDWANTYLFSVYRASLLTPLTYVRLIGHVFGHASIDHFTGNIFLILLLGPLLEEKYGSRRIIALILCTAVVTGAVQMLLFPNTALLGASGVVYAMIILSSFTSMKKDGRIPITFLLVAVIYLGGQIADGIFVQDDVSNLTHLIGGVIGGGFGFAYNRHLS